MHRAVLAEGAQNRQRQPGISIKHHVVEEGYPTDAGYPDQREDNARDVNRPGGEMRAVAVQEAREFPPPQPSGKESGTEHHSSGDCAEYNLECLAGATHPRPAFGPEIIALGI